jgi:hypothetical protein
MLSVSSYAKDHVDARRKSGGAACRPRKVSAAKPPGFDTFERQVLNHMILALDHHFLHRSRNMEGKDGNPLNEVRMLCNAIMESDGRMSADKTIRYKPEMSIPKFKPGDEIRLNADGLTRLSAPFFDEIRKKYP